MEKSRELQNKNASTVLTMEFSYRNFVDYGRILIGRIERNQLELARLCYRANEELGGQGKRNDLASANLSQLGQVDGHTFRDFCKDINISKTTAYRLLAVYNAEEDRLYTKEEIRAMAEEAWESLCEDIRYHRAHGEPSWKPEKWNDSLEFRYEQWLIQKGYRKADPIRPEYLGNISLPSDSYPLIGPFTFEFIDTIGHYCLEETSGNGAERFYDMCQRYKGRVPKGVEPNAVLRIPVLVKGAIAQLPAEARRDATILVANILRDYVEGEV